MSLGSPWMLVWLLPVVFCAWLMARAGRLRYEDACRLKALSFVSRRRMFGHTDWVTLASLVCVVAALTQPRWAPRSYDTERRGRDVVIALDVSRSMLAADVFPNRLEMARIAIHEALPTLAGQRVALVTFAGVASVPVPLTLDHAFVRYMLDRAGPSDLDMGSTSLLAALDKVATTILTDTAGRHTDLVVFTDGEDHLSDLDKTAELFSQCEARVLIVGLGDPDRGARVPDPADESKWMQHNNVEVVSRLDESILGQLADQSPKVTYFPARTRPFDLITLQKRFLEDVSREVTSGGLQQVRYTEGYPYLLGCAVLFLLASSSWRKGMRKMRCLIVVALLVPGCGRPIADTDEGSAVFRARCEQASVLMDLAREQPDSEPVAQRSLLLDAREEFLRAALLRPGHIETARRITALTRELRALETTITEQRGKAAQRREKLVETIGRLDALCVQQEELSQRSQEVLSSRPVPTGAEANLPEYLQDMGQFLPQDELNRLAAPLATEQSAVHENTQSVLDSLELQRDTLQGILRRAYGDPDSLPPTEVDPIVDLLNEAIGAQDQTLTSLDGEADWPAANTSLHIAAGQMRQALEALRRLQPPATDDKAGSQEQNAEGYDEDMELPESESSESGVRPISPGDYGDALSLRSLPIPTYSSTEILAEEAANQQKRAHRKARRAGAKVEKNW